MQQRVVLLAVLAACAAVLAAAQTPDCGGSPNMQPVFTAAPQLLATGANGKLMQVGGAGSETYVMHVYGTAYEMGYAHGSMLKTQINELYPAFMKYLAATVDQYIHKLPEVLRELIEKYGIEAALDVTYLMTKKYTPAAVFEELKGLADGSGLDEKLVIQLHMFPELIKAQCTLVGAWGDAIANSSVAGHLVQLRALDWGTDTPAQNYPMVLVYHPSDNTSHPFAILTFTGFVGFLTGMSSAPVGVCEKVWLSNDTPSSRIGAPWHFVLRDILQYDKDIDSAITRMADTQRTCSIWVGLGDGHSNEFRAVQYGHEVLNVYNDYDFPAYPPWHPLIKNVVFVDKHVQPSHNFCLNNILQAHYGSLDPETMYRNVVAELQTGDLHYAVYDYANMYMYFAWASPADAQGNVVPAYNRPATRIDLNAAFAEAL